MKIGGGRGGRPVWIGAAVLIGIGASVAFFGVDPDGAPDPEPLVDTVVVVAPHPDDEMQAWSQVQGRDRSHVVFLFLTLGEETRYCAEGAPGFDPGTGERRPDEAVSGRWSATCKSARISSTLRFLQAMHGVDGTTDERYEHLGPTGPFTDAGFQPCTQEGPSADCVPASTTAEVYQGSRSTAVFFDLGDGDLTDQEVVWAVRVFLDHRDQMSSGPSPLAELVAASFGNPDSPACFVYPHPDHAAVTRVVREHHFGEFTAQVAPVCRDDPAAGPVERVDGDVFAAAFEVEGERRIGPHVVEYGWLGEPYWPGDPGNEQQELFHRGQYFVRSFEQGP